MKSSVSALRRTLCGVLVLSAFAAGTTPAMAATRLAERTGGPAPLGETTPGQTPPADPTDLQGWLDYKTGQDIAALPHAALLLFRVGEEAQSKGDHEAAVRMWRGAEELDPSLLAPRFALARYFLSRDPSQALIEIARIVAMARTSFRVQHFMVSYALFYGLTALYLATLLVSLLLCWRHRHRLHHVYEELLQRVLPQPRARFWSWALVVLPFALGLGLAVPAALTLGLVWHYLRRNERVAWGLLVLLLLASPTVVQTFDSLSLAARPNEPPFYSTLDLDHEIYTPERMTEIGSLAAAEPTNAFLAFGEGWMAQRGGRYDEAVAAYQRAEVVWPREARIPNNLGNIEFLRGNMAEAEMAYKRAIELSSRWAAPHYNLGQLYTARFRYAEASQEIAQATALDFDLVRNLQARSAAQSLPALAEEWLEPPIQWQALFAPRGAHAKAGAVPPIWRPWFESRGTAVLIWAALFTALGLVGGWFLHRHLPARMCANCSAVVCRRCATRRREQVLCSVCASLVANATTQEFGKLLLFKRRRESRRSRSRLRTAITAVIPGYGAVASDRVITGWLFGLLATTCLLLIVSGGAPFPYDPRVPAGFDRPLAGIAVVGFLIVHFLSVAHYLLIQLRTKEQDSAADANAPKTPARVRRAA